MITNQQLFIDGNKRLAQLVGNKVLIESGVGILSIAADRIYEFKQKLVNYYENEVNKDDLVEFLKQQIVFIDVKND